jgi:hypothetical protein
VAQINGPKIEEGGWGEDGNVCQCQRRKMWTEMGINEWNELRTIQIGELMIGGWTKKGRFQHLRRELIPLETLAEYSEGINGIMK